MSTPVTPILPVGSTPDTDTFQVYSAAPAIGFLKRGIQPPGQLYIAPGDYIAVSCASSQTAEMVTVSYRLLRSDGLVILGQFVVQPPATRAVQAYREPLAEGFLLSVSCKAAAASTRGQTFVRISVTNPVLGSGQSSYVLLADYVTNQAAPAFPHGRVLSPTEGPGYVYSISAGMIPSGIDFDFQIPANARWAPISWTGLLSTSAAASNRGVSMMCVSGGLQVFRSAATGVQVASTQQEYDAARLAPYTPYSGAPMLMAIPPGLVLSPLGTVGSDTVGLLIGDNWSSVHLQVEEWLDNV